MSLLEDPSAEIEISGSQRTTGKRLSIAYESMPWLPSDDSHNPDTGYRLRTEVNDETDLSCAAIFFFVFVLVTFLVIVGFAVVKVLALEAEKVEDGQKRSVR